jgi:branched-chain amino acid transport system substrate-binding protein
MKTKLLFYSILFVVLMQIHATGAIAAPQAPQTIPIGAIVSLSGFDSNLGGQAKAGYELAAEEINRTGGVFVKEFNKKIPLEVIVQDMESNPTKAVSRMEYLYTSKKIVGYVGTTFIATGGTGVAEKNKIPTLVVASPRIVQHERDLKYWFSPTAKSPDNARIIFDLLDTIPADKRPKTVAIFQEQTDWGIEQAEYFKKEALQRGYKIVVHEKYSQMTKDMSSLIMAAKNAGAELVLSCPVTPDAMLMMRQIKELDYNPKVLVLLRGAEDLSWGKALGPMGDYVVLMGSWHSAVKYPGVDKLNAAHQAKFGRPADITTGPAYASIQTLAAAIEKAGTLKTEKIRDALSTIDTMTVIGKVKFRPNGTVIDPCPATVQWLKGSQKLVWPKEFRETPFVYPIPTWKDR